MILHLHPTRREALTAGESTLTRWSLATNPAAKLVQISTAPCPLFDIMSLQDGCKATYGGVTGAPDGDLFALRHWNPQRPQRTDPCVIELRHWKDLPLAKTLTVPQAFGPLDSIGSSPDGRWLVMSTGTPERIFLLDQQTGEVMSHHTTGGYLTTGLTFDPTSTFVAGVACHDAWGHLMLWRLDPAERFVSRSVEGRSSSTSTRFCKRQIRFECGSLGTGPNRHRLDRQGSR